VLVPTQIIPTANWNETCRKVTIFIAADYNSETPLRRVLLLCREIKVLAKNWQFRGSVFLSWMRINFNRDCDVVVRKVSSTASYLSKPSEPT